MKIAVAFLATLLALPGAALAHPAPKHSPPTCASPPHHAPKGTHTRARCVAGTVLGLTATKMQLKPHHGPAIVVVFTDKTVFQTDSGPGTLEGIMRGDFACISGTPKGHAFIAQVVVFDLSPFPCPSKKHHPPRKDHLPSAGSGSG